MTYSDLQSRVQAEQLTIFGTLLGARGTILLLGPHEPGFWPVLCESPEWQDGLAEPVNRWSQRVITRLADGLGRERIFLLEQSKPRFSPGPWPVTAPGSAPWACWYKPTLDLWSPIAALWNWIGKSRRLKRQATPVPAVPSPARPPAQLARYRASDMMLRLADPMCSRIQRNAASGPAVWPGAPVQSVRPMTATPHNRPITCGNF